MCVNVLSGMGIDESCHSSIRMYIHTYSPFDIISPSLNNI